jgi:hypothetical protein
MLQNAVWPPAAEELRPSSREPQNTVGLWMIFRSVCVFLGIAFHIGHGQAVVLSQPIFD